VLVALVQPRVVVARQTGGRHGARFHAVLQRLELAKQLLAAENLEPLVDAQDLHWKHISQPQWRFYVGAIGGATPKFLGGPNLRPTTDVIQARSYV